MILASLTRALKQQNWLAVAIEFVIVILGVVIGFQISAWNEGRQDRLRERAFVERLHAEVVEAEANRVGLLASVSQRVAHAEAIAEVVFEGRDPDTLPEGSCTSLARLGIFYLEGHSLPTLDELLATGSLDVVRDDALRESLTRYRSFADSAANRFSVIHRDMPALARTYPDLIATVPQREDGFLRMAAASCDYEAMRGNARFGTDLLDVLARAGFFLRNGLEAEDRRLAAMHAALDALLGEHAGAVGP